MHSPRAAIASSQSDTASKGTLLSVDRELLPLLVLIVGFGARLFAAWRYFLNPDEALHNLLASESSLSLAYRAALTNAHPPLLILVIHHWRWLGHSELMLRVPSVLAGTAACWLAYLWLRLSVDRSTAFVGLLLLALSPTLIGLSAEVRQYALLLFFISACLYCSEQALERNSEGWMALFSLALYGALFVHYSSFIFAFVMSVYILVRLYPFTRRAGLVTVWVAGQMGGVALAAYYYFSHVVPLSKTGMLSGGYDTWLRKSVYHAGEANVLAFVGRQTLRVFTFLLSHGFLGTLALLAFLTGLVLLLRNKVSLNEKGPTSRQLALLLGLPFLVNCAAAFTRQYPYGGTRHTSFLAIFAFSGAAIGLTAWRPSRVWITPLVVALALIFCNFFPAPPPAIRPRNQSRILMERAVDDLRQSVPPGATIVAAYQSGLLLGYYACGHGVVQVFPLFHEFAEADCEGYRVITTIPSKWKFYADDFPDELSAMAKIYNLAPGSKVWLFDAGWISDSAPALIRDRRVGCSSARTFGEDIFMCELTIGEGKADGDTRTGPP
jgi:4-amino-4-deoxy-L-arabinose transferase-like glycosyltransferase